MTENNNNTYVSANSSVYYPDNLCAVLCRFGIPISGNYLCVGRTVGTRDAGRYSRGLGARGLLGDGLPVRQSGLQRSIDGDGWVYLGMSVG